MAAKYKNYGKIIKPQQSKKAAAKSRSHGKIKNHEKIRKAMAKQKNHDKTKKLRGNEKNHDERSKREVRLFSFASKFRKEYVCSKKVKFRLR